MKIQNGDLLEILGAGNVSWYCEKVGRDENGLYEVYYIEKIHPQGNLYKYEDSYSLVEKESILTHVPNDGYKNAWAVFGFTYHSHDGDIYLERNTHQEKIPVVGETFEVLSTEESEHSDGESSITIHTEDTWSTEQSNDSTLDDFIEYDNDDKQAQIST